MLRLIACSLVLLLSLTSAEGSEPIRIGVSLGLTGQFSVMSRLQQKGYKLWEMDVNRKGGILGREVKLIIYDDKSDPDTARQLYQHMIEKDNVDFLFAPYSTLLTEAVLPLAENGRYPILVAGAAGDSLWEKDYKYVIGVYTPSSKFISGFLELLVRANLDKLAIVNADDPFSRDLADNAKVWARRYGLEVVFSDHFKMGTRDLEDLARRAHDSGAAVLIVCGHFDEAVNMREALKHVRWYPKAYYASVGPPLQSFYDRLGGDAELVFSTSLFEPKANFPGAQRFFEEFTATYKEAPGYHAALAYAGGQVIEAAIKTAGSVDREKVRAALFKLDAMTIIGRYGVDSTGRQIRQQSFIVQWQRGKKEIVWPEALKSASPIFGTIPTNP
jgi:branched-chain amino acid transport system substrate-binding protein